MNFFKVVQMSHVKGINWENVTMSPAVSKSANQCISFERCLDTSHKDMQPRPMLGSFKTSQLTWQYTGERRPLNTPRGCKRRHFPRDASNSSCSGLCMGMTVFHRTLILTQCYGFFFYPYLSIDISHGCLLGPSILDNVVHKMCRFIDHMDHDKCLSI